jgi:hypothetical protein
MRAAECVQLLKHGDDFTSRGHFVGCNETAFFDETQRNIPIIVRIASSFECAAK